MNIVVAGGTGFIGEPLVRALEGRGEVVVLSRDPSKVRAGRGVAWHPPAPGAWREDVGAADVVINLAGENIGQGRWTAERKQRIVASRLDATNALVDAMRSGPAKPRTFVSASAVGYYGSRGDEVLDEGATSGSGFLADVVKRWEEAAHAADAVARTVILRFGVVLAPEGGALRQMLPPFRMGVGGPLGSGRQWMSWIDRADLVRVVSWCIDREEARGVYNVTAPAPVTNRQFTRVLGRAVHRPAFLPVPAIALRVLFGEMADEMLLAGQRVVPARLEREGFSFGSAELEPALERLAGRA